MPGGGAEAFSLLGNETRLRIIQSLGDLSDPGEFSTISFSRLYEASDVADSGTFNYHLQKLTDQFVLSTDEGYRLSLQGINVYRGLRAGIFETEEDSLVAEMEGRRVATERVCTDCEVPKETWIEDGRIHRGCPECELVDMRYPVPAGGLRRAAESIAAGEGEAAYRVLRERLLIDHFSMLVGFCPYCAGETSVSISEDGELLPDPKNVDLGQVVSLVCEYCHWFLHSNLEMSLLSHPTVVPFLLESGLDPLESDLIWECHTAVTVESTDPWRLRGSVAAGAERIVLELDETLRADDSWVEPV
ncbi:helix-turn-helix domain-containing protein [Salinirubellus salinus]|uniref:Helix-turn-helix domain-containing protein n=1 Tax=Salinirubellus salinus TaxID=1364945 RepID=A0A9E7UA72_9EURY|nr:helix-turn-helix domain-containing protein [Salinirubellus salinus]UWM56701.1 helix-turn-helix domain-containing protein [Salinirubellus salinus]